MKVIILGLFFVLFLGSLFFSLERILYSDSSFILFRVINQDALQPQEQRYGSFITQMFPLIAARLNLPISWIVILYSASFNLFYLAVAAILVLKLKQYPLAILMSFYFILFVSESYYWPTNEVHQAIAWMFLFFGLLLYLSEKKTSLLISLPVLGLTAFLAIYTHPLALFPIIFLWVLLLLDRKITSAAYRWSTSIVLVLVSAAKLYFSSKGDHYDSMKLDAITHEFTIAKFFNALHSPLARAIVKNSLVNYWLVPLLVCWGAYSAIKAGKYRQVLWMLLSSLVYFGLICIVYNDFLPFYTESELMPATIILTSAFVYYSLPTIRLRYAVGLLALTFVLRLFYIGFSSEKFIERKNWLFATLRSMKEKNITKAFFYSEEFRQKEFLSHWAMPQESIIASAIENDRPRLTFIISDSAEIAARSSGNHRAMLDAYETWPIESVNKNYFGFDTVKSYQHIVPPQYKK